MQQPPADLFILVLRMFTNYIYVSFIAIKLSKIVLIG